MMETVVDEYGNVKGCIEWLPYKQGHLDDKGDIIFIGEMYISKQYRGNGVCRKLMSAVYDKCIQDIKGFMFYREYKYPGKGPVFYTKAQWLKIIGR